MRVQVRTQQYGKTYTGSTIELIDDEGNVEYVGHGFARRNPGDPFNAAVGVAVAEARALEQVARHRRRLADGLVKNADLQARSRRKPRPKPKPKPPYDRPQLTVRFNDLVRFYAPEDWHRECGAASPVTDRSSSGHWQCELLLGHKTVHSALSHAVMVHDPHHRAWDNDDNWYEVTE